MNENLKKMDPLHKIKSSRVFRRFSKFRGIFYILAKKKLVKTQEVNLSVLKTDQPHFRYIMKIIWISAAAHFSTTEQHAFLRRKLVLCISLKSHFISQINMYFCQS